METVTADPTITVERTQVAEKLSQWGISQLPYNQRQSRSYISFAALFYCKPLGKQFDQKAG